MGYLTDLLLNARSREQMLQIVHYVSDDPDRFSQLMDLFKKGDSRLCQRAAWPLSYCVEKHPELLNGYFSGLLELLERPPHNAVVRNILRMLQFTDIPDREAGRVMNHCFGLLVKPKEPVANKAFSMTILANLAKRYPEIKEEIVLCIEDQWPHASPGFRSRARKVRKEIEGK